MSDEYSLRRVWRRKALRRWAWDGRRLASSHGESSRSRTCSAGLFQAYGHLERHGSPMLRAHELEAWTNLTAVQQRLENEWVRSPTAKCRDACIALVQVMIEWSRGTVECYIHASAINAGGGGVIEFGDDDSVADILVRSLHEAVPTNSMWNDCRGELDSDLSIEPNDGSRERLSSE